MNSIGLIGLGKMGLSIALRLKNAQQTVWCFDVDAQACAVAQEHGLRVVQSYATLLSHATLIWIMIPAGPILDELLSTLIPLLSADHIIIDGGNSFYKDSVRRAGMLAQYNVAYLDCGTSGGVHGLENGYCLMVGGDKKAYDTIAYTLKIIAASNGLAYVGPSGAGHYAKMVHNGIEYALLAAYAEGFALLKRQESYAFDLEKLSTLWTHGSIIRSWILELLSASFKEHDPDLEHISGQLDANGTGHWTLAEANNYQHAMNLLQYALEQRNESSTEGKDKYANKLIALMRHQFGGHKYYKN